MSADDLGKMIVEMAARVYVAELMAGTVPTPNDTPTEQLTEDDIEEIYNAHGPTMERLIRDDADFRALYDRFRKALHQ